MEKEIKSISFGSMSNGAHFNFMQATIERVEEDEKVSAKVPTEQATLKSAFGVEDANLKVSQKSELTDQIRLWDTSRDGYYSGYKGAVKGFLKMPEGDLLTAAKKLWQHIVDYKIDTKMQLDRQTGMMTNFIADLEDKFATEVQTLGLTAFRDKMKEANDKVRELLKARDTESASREVGAMKAARRATEEAYLALIKKVNAYALIEGAADYEAFIDGMNAQIKRYKQEVLGQGGSSDTPSEETPGEPENPDGGDGGDEGTDLPFEPTDPNPDEGGDDEEETPSVV